MNRDGSANLPDDEHPLYLSVWRYIKPGPGCGERHTILLCDQFQIVTTSYSPKLNVTDKNRTAHSWFGTREEFVECFAAVNT